jgi:uncharacterized protein YjbI with pentapeptide repeats
LPNLQRNRLRRDAEEVSWRLWEQGLLTPAQSLSGAILSGADLSGAILSGAEDLTQEQLEEANGDESTRLPSELKPPSHWIGQSAEQTEED